jgi:hypothetical protein
MPLRTGVSRVVPAAAASSLARARLSISLSRAFISAREEEEEEEEEEVVDCRAAPGTTAEGLFGGNSPWETCSLPQLRPPPILPPSTAAFRASS